MDDPQNTAEPSPPEESVDPGAGHEPVPSFAESAPEPNSALVSQGLPEDLQQYTQPYTLPSVAPDVAAVDAHAKIIDALEDGVSRRRSFRHNLFLLLALALAAFILTSWILVRVDSPFGIFSSGPQEVVRAQLRALDRGELRPAYDMFSARYRGQVSFDTWHELFVTHWRMFHAEVVRADTPAYGGPGVTLEIYLHGADDKDYRARFTLVHTDGRWWIDDVHWTEEADEQGISRT